MTEQAATTSSVVSVKLLLEAGAHFGHQVGRWNPKMKRYIFIERNGIHIINLEQTINLLDKASRLMIWIPFRSMKMYLFILGFHRPTWWPKCAPASRSAFTDTTLLVVVPCSVISPHNIYRLRFSSLTKLPTCCET